MEQKRLLTEEDLAERWQCSKQTITKAVKKGTLKPCPGLLNEVNFKRVRFDPDYIESLEVTPGTDIETQLKERENRKIKREVERLTKERDEARAIIQRIVGIGFTAISDTQLDLITKGGSSRVR